MNYLTILLVSILSIVLLTSSDSSTQNELEPNRDVYIFVQNFVRNSDGQLISIF
jgi:hypothetical protein